MVVQGPALTPLTTAVLSAAHPHAQRSHPPASLYVDHSPLLTSTGYPRRDMDAPSADRGFWRAPQKKERTAWNKGKKMSAETREKMSAALKKRWQEGSWTVRFVARRRSVGALRPARLPRVVRMREVAPVLRKRRERRRRRRRQELMQQKDVSFQKGRTPWNKGQAASVETRQRMSSARVGKQHSPETRALMSESAMGRQFSDETRAKLSASTEGRSQGQLERQRLARDLREKQVRLFHRKPVRPACVFRWEESRRGRHQLQKRLHSRLGRAQSRLGCRGADAVLHASVKKCRI